MAIKRYELIIEYNPDSDEIETVSESIITDDKEITFIGNIDAVDYMDDEAISMLTSYIIADC
tara:strand:- start:551 stop:736 length:186 start_codon:yes stop_codon:yes gene_type:complete